MKLPVINFQVCIPLLICFVLFSWKFYQMEVLRKYQAILEDHLRLVAENKEPHHLYEPIRYMLSIGGKRVRPALTLMAYDFFGDNPQLPVPAALAVELFHNFSLIHDDIMDRAPLRRGEVTVHKKWDINTGILSGDAMLILAYRFFENYPPFIFRELARLFSETALQVCEGQQMDMDFENRDDVTIEQYLKMIELKTAVLIGAAMKMGAIVAEASEADQASVYEFGKNLGIAFQLQDDFLDVFGDPESFGKQVGGDIIANKKTYLYLMAARTSKPQEVEELVNLYSISPSEPDGKIAAVKKIFINSGAAQAAQVEIEKFSKKAYSELTNSSLSEEGKTLLENFGKELMKRQV